MPLRIKLALVTLALAGLAFMLEPHVRKARADYGSEGFPAAGATTASGYHPDIERAAFRTSRGIADSTSVAVLTSTTANFFPVLGRPTISVGARFTGASDSIKVYVILLNQDRDSASATFGQYFVKRRWAAQTITGSTTTDAAGKFMELSPAVFDSLGATHALICVDTAPATLTDLWAGAN